MSVDDLYFKHFGNHDFTLASGELRELLPDGGTRPVFTAEKVRIGSLIEEAPASSVANIVSYRFRLSPIQDPFWLELFHYFEKSGFSVRIDDSGALVATSFSGLIETTLSIARNCVSLANSTYSHFRTVAEKAAYVQDKLRGVQAIREAEEDSDGTASLGLA